MRRPNPLADPDWGKSRYVKRMCVVYYCIKYVSTVLTYSVVYTVNVYCRLYMLSNSLTLSIPYSYSRMEIVAEALKFKEDEARKVKLMKVLEQYHAEEEVNKELKVLIAAREEAVEKLMNAGVDA